jgi:LAO/AO transport system kinase
LRKRSLTGHYIYFQQKNQVGYPPQQPVVRLDGIPDLGHDCKFVEQTKGNDYFNAKRSEQNEYWMLETINEQLKLNFITIPKFKTLLDSNKKAVQNGEISPFAAAQICGKNFKNI